jgi:hypothetical protein
MFISDEGYFRNELCRLNQHVYFWWRLLQKWLVQTKLDIYICITNVSWCCFNWTWTTSLMNLIVLFCLLVWWCWMPLSTIFQLYHGSQFYWWRKPENPEKTTDLSQVTDNIYYIMLYTSPWSRFEFTTSVVIDTDCIGSCKSNYCTIMTTTTPW